MVVDLEQPTENIEHRLVILVRSLASSLSEKEIIGVSCLFMITKQM